MFPAGDAPLSRQQLSNPDEHRKLLDLVRPAFERGELDECYRILADAILTGTTMYSATWVLAALPAETPPDDRCWVLNEGDASQAWGGLYAVLFQLIEIFEKRGIDAQVKEARGYVRYTPENPAPFRAAFEPAVKEGVLSEAQLRTMMGWAAQAPGHLITRYVPPGIDAKPIYPEIRPDHGIMVESPRDAKAREASWKRRTPEKFAENWEKWSKLGERAILKKYPAAELAKYVFMPSAWITVPYWHDHGEYVDDPEGLAQHEAEVDHPDGRQGEHRHKRPVKDRKNGAAKRIDMHPLAVPLFENAERVFFGIEGCLKADAIRGRGEAVLSVPSVTCWKAPELQKVIDAYLLGKTVYIVPDADWRENDLVIGQAMHLRQTLRRRGVEAYVAAPPVEANAERDPVTGKLKRNGVDDMLGARDESGRLKYSIDDLVIVNREVPKEALRQWVRQQDGRNALRNARVLECISLHAGKAGLAQPGSKEPPGALRRSVGTLAGILGCSRDKVVGALEELLELSGLTSPHAITMTEGALETFEGMKKTRRGHRWHQPLEWADPEDRPVFAVASEFEVKELDPVRLGDFEPGAEQFAPTDLTDALADRDRRKKSERQARWRARSVS